MSAPAGAHILPYKAKCIRALFGHLMHFVYLTIFSNYGRWYTANINFQFPNFNLNYLAFFAELSKSNTRVALSAVPVSLRPLFFWNFLTASAVTSP